MTKTKKNSERGWQDSAHKSSKECIILMMCNNPMGFHKLKLEIIQKSLLILVNISFRNELLLIQ